MPHWQSCGRPRRVRWASPRRHPCPSWPASRRGRWQARMRRLPALPPPPGRARVSSCSCAWRRRRQLRRRRRQLRRRRRLLRRRRRLPRQPRQATAGRVRTAPCATCRRRVPVRHAAVPVRRWRVRVRPCHPRRRLRPTRGRATPARCGTLLARRCAAPARALGRWLPLMHLHPRPACRRLPLPGLRQWCGTSWLRTTRACFTL